MFSLKMVSKLAKILKSTSPEISEHLEKLKFPIMPKELYQLFGLENIPKICEYDDEEGVVIKKHPYFYQLSVNGEGWMTFDPFSYAQLFQVYSHYNLAEGHCICTGLGFGLREKFLLSKSKVSKVTVLEKNIGVINYHKKFNPELVNEIQIINCDASEYKGHCDTLLLDHYEYEPSDLPNYIKNLKLCRNNIEHKILWFWPLEKLIDWNSEDLTTDKYEEYLKFKKEFPSLPDLSESQLISYCDMYDYWDEFLSDFLYN